MNLALFALGVTVLVVPLIIVDHMGKWATRNQDRWWGEVAYVGTVIWTMISVIFAIIFGLAFMVIAISETLGAEKTREMEIYYLDITEGRGKPPRKNTAYICHAHGCQQSSRYRFSRNDLHALQGIMSVAKTPADERANIRRAIAWAERQVCKSTGTCGDKAGSGWQWSGVSGQLDCVDETTNVISYLSIMRDNNLLRYHSIMSPVWKGFPLAHWGARILDKTTKKQWVVDSYWLANGELPQMVLHSRW